MSPHLEHVYSKFLSAYRTHYKYHSILIHTTGLWKKSFDKRNFFGNIMSDLSKVFDCLPNDLMIEKFKCYNLGDRESALVKCSQRDVQLGVVSLKNLLN